MQRSGLPAAFPFADLEISQSQRMTAKRATAAETGRAAGGRLWAVLKVHPAHSNVDAAHTPMAAMSPNLPNQHGAAKVCSADCYRLIDQTIAVS